MGDGYLAGPPRKNRIGVIGGPNGDTYMLTLDLGLCLHNGAFGEWEGQPATSQLNNPMTIIVRSRRWMRGCCCAEQLVLGRACCWTWTRARSPSIARRQSTEPPLASSGGWGPWCTPAAQCGATVWKQLWSRSGPLCAGRRRDGSVFTGRSGRLTIRSTVAWSTRQSELNL